MEEFFTAEWKQQTQLIKDLQSQVSKLKDLPEHFQKLVSEFEKLVSLYNNRMSLKFDEVVPSEFLVLPQQVLSLDNRVDALTNALKEHTMFSAADKDLINSLIATNEKQSQQIAALLAAFEEAKQYKHKASISIGTQIDPSEFVVADATTQGEKTLDQMPPPPPPSPKSAPTPPLPESPPPSSPKSSPAADDTQGEDPQNKGKKPVTEEDPLLAEIDAYMEAGPSSGPIKKKAFQFLDLSADEVVSVDPAEVLLQEQELERLKKLREEELASAAEVEKAKEEEAKAYKKVAEATERRMDSTALQQKEIELLSVQKAKQHAEKEMKKLEQWNDYVKKMNFRLHPEPITEVTWAIRNNKLDLTVYRGANPFNFQVIREATIGMFGVSEWAEMLEIIRKKRKGKIQTDLMEALQRRFTWKQKVEKKFEVDLSQPLAEQGPAAKTQKKRKRVADGAEVRVTEEPKGEGLAPRNLTLPRGVKFSEGKVISEPEHGMFFTNNAQMECFQRVNELHLCSTWQLYLLKSTCQRGSNDADFLALIEIELEPRDKDVKKLKKAKLEEMNIE